MASHAVARYPGPGPAGLAAVAADFDGEMAVELASRNARANPREHDPNFLLLQRALDYLHHRGAVGCGAGECGCKASSVLPPPPAAADPRARRPRSPFCSAPDLGAGAVCQPGTQCLPPAGGDGAEGQR